MQTDGSWTNGSFSIEIWDYGLSSLVYSTVPFFPQNVTTLVTARPWNPAETILPTTSFCDVIIAGTAQPFSLGTVGGISVKSSNSTWSGTVYIQTVQIYGF